MVPGKQHRASSAMLEISPLYISPVVTLKTCTHLSEIKIPEEPQCSGIFFIITHYTVVGNFFPGRKINEVSYDLDALLDNGLLVK